MDERPPVPLASAATPSTPDPAAQAADIAAAPGGLSERHHKYAEEFKQWLLGLNRRDFAQARNVLEAMTRAYFKHTVKIHSPPMRENNEDVPGKTSNGAADPVLHGDGREPAVGPVVELHPKP